MNTDNVWFFISSTATRVIIWANTFWSRCTLKFINFNNINYNSKIVWEIGHVLKKQFFFFKMSFFYIISKPYGRLEENIKYYWMDLF